MGKWFGDLWPLRFMLLIAAGAISIGLLPWSTRRLQPVVAVDYKVPGLYGSTLGRFGPPLFLVDRTGQSQAWDWRTGRFWLIPSGILPQRNHSNPHADPLVACEGEHAAIANLNDKDEIELTDLAPPFKTTIVTLPLKSGDALVLANQTIHAIDQTRNFTLIEDGSDRRSNEIRTCKTPYGSKLLDVCYRATGERRFEVTAIMESARRPSDDDERLRSLNDWLPKATRIDHRTLELKPPQKSPIHIFVPAGIFEFKSSLDGKELVTIDRQSTIQVWDIATGKLVAESSLIKRKTMFAAMIVTIGLLIWPASVAVAAREGQLWWAMFDCFTSTCIAMVWVCEVSGLAGLSLLETGFATAAGVYLASSLESVWRRLLLVIVAEFVRSAPAT